MYNRLQRIGIPTLSALNCEESSHIYIYKIFIENLFGWPLKTLRDTNDLKSKFSYLVLLRRVFFGYLFINQRGLLVELKFNKNARGKR